MSQIAERIIFLGGSPRSGTTLVQNMLDSHPDVLGGPEFLHLVDILKLRTQLRTSVEKEWINLFCSREDVDQNIRNLVRALLLPLADAQRSNYLSEKSPDNVLVLNELAELFPNSKVIHIIRDPRAVMASLIAAGKRAESKGETRAPFTRTTMAATRYISRCLRAGFRASENHPSRVYTLIYESLVADPEQETKKLCKFLELQWSDTMLRPAEKTHLGEAAITENSKEIWYDKETYYSNPNTERIEAWRDELALYQEILAKRAFSKIPQLNYDLSIRRGNLIRYSLACSRAYSILLITKLREKLAHKLSN